MADSRYGGAWPIGRGGLDDRAAPELLVDAIERSPAPVTLVTLGPLTNLAAALARDASFTSHVGLVVSMGGALDVSGNTANAEPPPVRDVAEWNVYADSQAADDVVRSGVPLQLVPLDATTDLPLDAYVLRAVAKAPANDAMAAVGALLSGVHPMISSGDYYLWDPLAAVLALHPELGTKEERRVDVVTRGVETGRTVTSGGGAPVEIFTAADGRAAEMALLSGLTGGHVARIAKRPDLVVDARVCDVSRGRLRAGPAIVQVVAKGSASLDGRGVVIGRLDRGRGLADIEAFFAAPAPDPPDWFTISATLGGGVGGPPVDLVRLTSGDYTVVCVKAGSDQVELAGVADLSVR
jgi:hypothetical protein